MDFQLAEVKQSIYVDILSLPWGHQHRKANANTDKIDRARAKERKKKGLPTEYYCRSLYWPERGAFFALPRSYTNSVLVRAEDFSDQRTYEWRRLILQIFERTLGLEMSLLIFYHVFFWEYVYDPSRGSIKQLPSHIKLCSSAGQLNDDTTISRKKKGTCKEGEVDSEVRKLKKASRWNHLTMLDIYAVLRRHVRGT
ncbi:hypothetical protein Pfo_007969 [Paulownia fortunei]|nr:hypothetical protein Pfo_007969 [Paulownia fortunei]